MSQSTSHNLDPVRKTRSVPIEPDQACALFTDRMEAWWPLAGHSVSGNVEAGITFGRSAGTKVVEVTGSDRVEGITLEDIETGEREEREASALFIFVGAVPHSQFLQETVELNEKGFVYTGADVLSFTEAWPLDRDPFALETSVPGVFAAGDIREGAVRRVASAVGEGSIAVTFVHRYLDTV